MTGNFLLYQRLPVDPDAAAEGFEGERPVAATAELGRSRRPLELWMVRGISEFGRPLNELKETLPQAGHVVQAQVAREAVSLMTSFDSIYVDRRAEHRDVKVAGLPRLRTDDDRASDL